VLCQLLVEHYSKTGLSVHILPHRLFSIGQQCVAIDMTVALGARPAHHPSRLDSQTPHAIDVTLQC